MVLNDYDDLQSIEEGKALVAQSEKTLVVEIENGQIIDAKTVNDGVEGVLDDLRPFDSPSLFPWLWGLATIFLIFKWYLG